MVINAKWHMIIHTAQWNILWYYSIIPYYSIVKVGKRRENPELDPNVHGLLKYDK